MKKSVAIIGQGFVGGSLTTVFAERGFDVYTYDKTGKQVSGGKHPHSSTEVISHVGHTPIVKMVRQPANSVVDLVNACEQKKNFSGVYFVCVPTPMYEDGSADLSIVHEVLKELASLPIVGTSTSNGRYRIAVIKSTVPPGSTERWNKSFNKDGLYIVFNPEFLTEANALDDMRNQNRIILGGPRPHINMVKQIFQTAFPKVPLIKTSSTTAEMVKYTTNCFLATKVSFANEIAQICEKLDESGLDIDYDKVIEYAKYDKRLGNSHWAVPGPDGKRAFGGHCFPKDLNSLMFLAKQLGIDPKVMIGTWEKCLELRPSEHRDWEQMKGRAVSKKEDKSQ